MRRLVAAWTAGVVCAALAASLGGSEYRLVDNFDVADHTAVARLVVAQNRGWTVVPFPEWCQSGQSRCALLMYKRPRALFFMGPPE